MLRKTCLSFSRSIFHEFSSLELTIHFHFAFYWRCISQMYSTNHIFLQSCISIRPKNPFFSSSQHYALSPLNMEKRMWWERKKTEGRSHPQTQGCIITKLWAQSAWVWYDLGLEVVYCSLQMLIFVISFMIWHNIIPHPALIYQYIHCCVLLN